MITSGRVTVGSVTPLQIGVSSVNPVYLTVHNDDNTKVIYFGGPDVTVGNGLQLLKEQTLRFTLNPGEAFYAISASGDHSVSFISQTV